MKHVVGIKDNPIHEVQRNLMLVEHFTSDVDVTVKLYPARQDYEKIASIKHEWFSHINNKLNSNSIKYKSENFREYVCIAPSSVWFTKQYPKEKWIEFIKHINVQIPIFLLGSPGDRYLCEEIKNTSQDHLVYNMCSEASLLQSAALMQDAIMNYTNDSSPMHIASAMNAPITAIFCSTATWFGFTPLSTNSYIVEKEEALYCRPCTYHGKRACPEKHFKCANDITAQQLLATLSQVNKKIQESL